MIILLATRWHLYTHKSLTRNVPVDLRVWSYEAAFRRTRFPRATYIFTDFDRLGYWELELAGRLHAELRAAGLRILNDPARALQRFALLRRLKDRGINSFDVWRVEDGAAPTRFPVFLRTQSAHRGILSDLLGDQIVVDEAVERALVQGTPLRELMLVEYRAEPVAGDLFRKLSAYRIGDRIVPAASVHETQWNVKYGTKASAGQHLYEEERDLIERNAFEDALRPAFALAGIDYGRADFGLVAGRLEIYEINTNPAVPSVFNHPVPARLETLRLGFRLYCEAMQAIDAGEGGKSVRVTDELLRQNRVLRWARFGQIWRI